LANNKIVIQQQRAKQQELETARFASLAETTKENETREMTTWKGLPKGDVWCEPTEAWSQYGSPIQRRDGIG